MTKEPTFKEKLDKSYEIAKIFENLDEKTKNKAIKKLKIPKKAKTSKRKRKKGWCGILFLNENRNISGQKVKLDGGTYRTQDDYIHVTNGSELLFWEGKYPILFQRYDKLNPTNLFVKENEKNEIYGQDLVKLRYKRDLIKEKKKGKVNILVIVIIIIAGYFLTKTFFPGLLGG